MARISRGVRWAPASRARSRGRSVSNGPGVRAATSGATSLTGRASMRPSPVTAKRFHSSGTPFNVWVPRSVNSMPDPSTSSFTVPETTISPAPAWATILAATFTAMPARSSPRRSHSPVWIPARISIPNGSNGIASMARAARIAFAGPSNTARNPSPRVLIARPPKFSICARTTSSWRSTRAFHRSSPSSAARSVEETMSVNRIVANARSGSARWRDPVRNSSISSMTGSQSPTQIRWSRPGNSTYFAPGISWARYRPSSTGTKLLSRFRIKVGEEICASAERTSISLHASNTAAAMPGLAQMRSPLP